MTQDQIQQDLNAIVHEAFRQSKHDYLLQPQRSHWIRNIIISAIAVGILYGLVGCASTHYVKSEEVHPADHTGDCLHVMLT